MELSELLLENDENNCAKFLEINLQERKHGIKDMSKDPLFTYVQPELYNVPTVAALRALYGHFKPVVSEEEEMSEDKTKRELDFIEACVNTKVMEITREWIYSKSRGKAKARDKTAFKDLLHKMWFAPYARSNRSHGVEGSCAFEHVFLGEESGHAVKGFHNWLYFLEEEKKGEVNYFGYEKAIKLGDKGCVLKSVFEWKDMVKPVSSFLVGFSPELEMAIYTVCAMFCPGNSVRISLAGEAVNVRTYVSKDEENKPCLETAYVAV